jgi:hypothetical protein
MLKKIVGYLASARTGMFATMALAGCLTVLSAPAAYASSALKEEFAPFDDCPVSTASVCEYATTTAGEFVIARKTVPITKTIVLQGGLATESYAQQPLLAPAEGEALAKVPMTVPGGLVGIGELGGEVTATAELAGPPSSIAVDRSNFVEFSGTAVTLPLKVHLENATLGEDCYLGSDSEPIVLHLTTGVTSPPAPAEPIKGTHSIISDKAKGKIRYIEQDTLVDNDFAVPGASGCGGELSPLVDALVDADVGVPSPAGENTAIMSGSLEETAAAYAAKYKPKPKKTRA